MVSAAPGDGGRRMGRAMKRASMAISCIGLVSALAGALQGDTLVTTEGRSFHGRLVSEDGGRIVFEIHQYGAKMLKTFRKAQVKSITRGAAATRPAGAPPEKPRDPGPKPPPIVKYDLPNYYVIPFEGHIGMHVTGPYLARCLADVARRRPDVVVLYVDSAGGVTSEVDRLVELIGVHGKELRIVAYVRKALSAAAITALACKEIYVEPRAIFGAATAYQTGALDLPVAIAEKFQSAWRARARSAAAVGGHNPLLAEAMIDSSLQLHLVREKTGRVRVEAGPGAKMLTARGKLLTMTAAEAVEAGLAKAAVENLVELGDKLGFPRWVECQGHATLLADHVKNALADYLKKSEKLRARFSENMRKAAAASPDSPKAPYQYYGKSGRFTAESQRRWRQRSRQCANWLMRAEADVREMAEFGERFEELKVHAAYFRKLQERIQARRLEIVRNLNKRGPDD